MNDRTEKKLPTKSEPTYADQLAAAQELVKRTDAAVEKAAKAAYDVVRAYKAAVGEKPAAWAHAGADLRSAWLLMVRGGLNAGEFSIDDGDGVDVIIAKSVIREVLRRELGIDG